MNWLKNSIVALMTAFSIVSIGSLTGCASVNKALSSPAGQQAMNYTINASVVQTSLVEVVPLLKQAKIDVDNHMSTFSPSNKVVIQSGIQNIQSVVSRAQSIIGGKSSATNVVIKLSQIEYMYSSAKVSYMQLRPIIAKKMSKFPAKTQYDLKTLDSVAQRLNSSMKQLHANPSAQKAQNVVQNLLTLSASIATVVNAVYPPAAASG